MDNELKNVTGNIPILWIQHATDDQVRAILMEYVSILLVSFKATHMFLHWNMTSHGLAFSEIKWNPLSHKIQVCLIETIRLNIQNKMYIEFMSMYLQ